MNMEEPLNQNAAIKNWTQKEKFDLLQALKASGKIDMKTIEKAVETKTPEEVKKAVEFYRHVALHHPIFEQMRQKQREKKERLEARREYRKRSIELLKWQELVMGTLSKGSGCAEMAAALRVIAEWEGIPPPEMTDNVDYKQVYIQIANAMEGKPVEADSATIAVMKRCLAETSLRSNKMNDIPEVKQFLLKFVETKKGPDGKPIPPKPTPTRELAILRRICTKQYYLNNNMEVPEDLLKTPTGSSAKGTKGANKGEKRG